MTNFCITPKWNKRPIKEDIKTIREQYKSIGEKVILVVSGQGDLKENLAEKNLPDGNLHWNIAKRVLVPLMQDVQRTCLDMAEAAQKRQDKKNGIGIKPIRPPFNEERIDAVLNKTVFISQMPEVPDIEQ